MSTKVWLGVLVIPYKKNPTQILIVKNIKTGNITPIAGAKEEIDENLLKTCTRELKEEIGWDVDEKDLVPTDLVHEFVYEKRKSERAGDKCQNHVFLLDATNYPDPLVTKDTKDPQWVNSLEAKSVITFHDLAEIVDQAIMNINYNL